MQYSVGIVYNVPRRLWAKSEIQIFVDGELKKVAIMKTPNFSDVSVAIGRVDNSYLGCCIDFFLELSWEGDDARVGSTSVV